VPDCGKQLERRNVSGLFAQDAHCWSGWPLDQCQTRGFRRGRYLACTEFSLGSLRSTDVVLFEMIFAAGIAESFEELQGQHQSGHHHSASEIILWISSASETGRPS
jgi:hypothetical protein